MPLAHITTLGIDADDTLWESEQYFKFTEAEFRKLLAPFLGCDELSQRLLEIERRNLKFYGFGIKGFVLSLIETALEMTEGQVSQAVIAEILRLGREMVAHPIITLPGVKETLATLKQNYRLILITKGDLFDQERKIAESGLDGYFDGVEIVSEKTTATYQRIFTQYGDGVEYAAMIGNSLKSDIWPALEAGSSAIFIPHALTWAHEHIAPPENHQRYFHIENFPQLLSLLRK